MQPGKHFREVAAVLRGLGRALLDTPEGMRPAVPHGLCDLLAETKPRFRSSTFLDAAHIPGPQRGVSATTGGQP